jgi:drug/metabolite transporter (DMT)-like permease
MSLNSAAKATLQIHFCVVAWGFTAILGKLISLPALPLVWWRILIVVAVLGMLPRVWNSFRAMSNRHVASFAGVGVLVALHWLTFYGVINLSGAAVAAISIALSTVFVAPIETWLTGVSLRARDLFLGMVMLPAVALMTGGMPHEMRVGMVVGIVSAISLALFTALNKRLIRDHDPLAVTAIELGAGLLALTLLAPVMPWIPRVSEAFAGSLLTLPESRDLVLLLVLSLFCTLLPFALSLLALRHVSAFSAQIAYNLEPIYTIMLAVVLLEDCLEQTPKFYFGVMIILSAIALHTIVNRKKSARGCSW